MNELLQSVPEIRDCDWRLAGLFRNAAEVFKEKEMPDSGYEWYMFRSGYYSAFIGLHHFGMECPHSAVDMLREGLAYGHEYFTAKRCKGQAKSRWLMIIDRPWTYGLLLGEAEKVSDICTWLDPDRTAEFAGDYREFNYEIKWILGLLATLFSPRTEVDVARMEAQITPKKSKIIDELLAGCRAVRDGDAAGFQKAVKSGLALHSRSIRAKVKRDPAVPIAEFFHLPFSILWRAAELRGMETPELPLTSAAFLWTRKSLHLEGE